MQKKSYFCINKLTNCEAMENNNQEFPYLNKLNAIMKTCLLFNDKDSFAQFLGYKPSNIETNGLRKLNEFTQRAYFHEFVSYANEQIPDDEDFEEFMDAYEEASDFFHPLRRTYSINLRVFNPKSEADLKKRERIFAFLNYFYSDEEETQESIQKHFGSDKSWLFGVHDKQTGRIKYSPTILFLLLIGFLPSFGAKQQPAVSIFEEAKLLRNFLDEYVKQTAAKKMMGNSAFLTRFFNEVSIYRRKREGDLGRALTAIEESEVLNRWQLYSMTSRFLQTVLSFSNQANTLSLNQNLKYFYPEIEGYWKEEGKKDFWKIEKLSNSFFFFHFEPMVITTTDEHGLFYSRYEGSFFEMAGLMQFYLVHPCVATELRDNQIPSKICYSYPTFFSKGKTVKSFAKAIDKMEFDIVLNPGNWIQLPMLERVKDQEFYDKQFRNLKCKNKYPQFDYSLVDSLYAITLDHIYFKIEKDYSCFFNDEFDPESELNLLRIPKSISPAFDDVHIYDFMGFLRSNDNRLFISLPAATTFIEITNCSQREKLDITVC